MPEFLKLSSVDNALDLFIRSIPEVNLPVETIDTPKALGRVLTENVISKEDLPAFPRSTVDGYAVHSEDTFGSSESIPAYIKLMGEVRMGFPPDFSIKNRECALIHTGGMLPNGCNAVVMVENTQISRASEIEVQKAVSTDENCISIGEDVAVGDMILGAGTIIRPQEVGGLLAVGKTRVKVVKPPKVGILSTGDEVVAPENSLPLGKVRDINSSILAGMVTSFGGQAVEYGISPDNEDELTQRVKKAYDECNAVVITAGSSVSTRDLTAKVIARLGDPGVLVHGVNIKPGKPTILAVCDGKPLVGLPGNPVSAYVIARLFVKPMVLKMLGVKRIPVEPIVCARMQSNFPSQTGRKDLVPIILSKIDGELMAKPIHFKSNLIFSLVHADGLAVIPEDSNGLVTGDEVKVLLI